MPQNSHLQEVVLAVHFVEPLPLTVLDVAAWITEYGGVSPSFQELPFAPPMQMPSPGQAMVPFNVQFMGEISEVPRIRIRGRDPQTFHVMQCDRLALVWQRDVEIGKLADYPGFDELRAKWLLELDRFTRWVNARLSQTFLPRLVELTYSNAYPLSVDGRTRRMSDIFQFLKGDYRPVNAFGVSWAEFLGSPAEGAVNAQAGLGHAPGGQRVFAVNYTGLAAIPEGLKPSDVNASLLDRFDVLHQRITDMHKAAVVQDGI